MQQDQQGKMTQAESGEIHAHASLYSVFRIRGQTVSLAVKNGITHVQCFYSGKITKDSDAQGFYWELVI